MNILKGNYRSKLKSENKYEFGGSFMSFFGTPKNEEPKTENEENKAKTVEDGKLHLRKEELDISKNRVKIGDVEISKEVVEEQKVVNVPVKHEEVVIKRMAVDNEPSESPIGVDETIRIPVSEERIEVGKHTVVTGEISASKREVEETKEVKESLKREEARLRKDGDPNIVSDDNNNIVH